MTQFNTSDQDEVYRETDLDIAYNKFIELFKLLYSKNDLIQMINTNNKYKNGPYLTKGLQPVCEKKSNLYGNFIKLNN